MYIMLNHVLRYATLQHVHLATLQFQNYSRLQLP
jgi:hypothetical protein